MKVLIVRAAEDARRTAARLAAAGHQAIVAKPEAGSAGQEKGPGVATGP